MSADYEFYTKDCIRFGLEPSRKKTKFPTNDIPNFNKKEPSSSQLSDELSELEYKVANIANYFQNEEKLVEHLNEVNLYLQLNEIQFNMIIIQCDPDVILHSWCYSLNGDVSMLLRSEGVFSQMILNNDLRIITGNPLARLNDIQRQIIKGTGHIFDDIKDLTF